MMLNGRLWRVMFFVALMVMTMTICYAGVSLAEFFWRVI